MLRCRIGWRSQEILPRHRVSLQGSLKEPDADTGVAVCAGWILRAGAAGPAADPASPAERARGTVAPAAAHRHRRFAPRPRRTAHRPSAARLDRHRDQPPARACRAAGRAAAAAAAAGRLRAAGGAGRPHPRRGADPSGQDHLCQPAVRAADRPRGPGTGRPPPRGPGAARILGAGRRQHPPAPERRAGRRALRDRPDRAAGADDAARSQQLADRARGRARVARRRRRDIAGGGGGRPRPAKWIIRPPGSRSSR